MGEEARAQLVAYIAGTRREFSFPVDCSARHAVSAESLEGDHTDSLWPGAVYQWVAMRVGGKQYAGAVGMALGANPVPIVVPCHRIISHDGSLGGFSCGLPLKRRLLSLEGTLNQLRNAQ
ncbi:MAG: MGMT family protein [Nitrospira sp.]|nr:MGMT family protein [Nitrospira sp.]